MARFYGKAEGIARQIVEAFERGDVPKALAQVYIHRADNVPCRAWSRYNQFLVALAGTDDARGFRQWQEVGRKVKKGAKAFHILAPCVKKFEEADDEGNKVERRVIVGFRSVPVFRVEDTEGEPLQIDENTRRFVEALPLVDVARSWGLDVQTYSGQGAGALGYYRPGVRIALGTENLSTWAHELVHAAEDRLGNLNERPGQQIDNEIVAELGGAVLLEAIGRPVDADRGGAYQYCKAYAERAKRPLSEVCYELLNRVADAVNLILTEADELAATEPFEA